MVPGPADEAGPTFVASSLRYLRAAFVLPANLIALGAAGVASWLVGSWTPLWVMAAAEGAYLALLVTAPAFQRAVQAQLSAASHSREARRQLAAMQDDLSPSQREHFQALSALKEKILANYRRLPGGRVMAASSDARLSALLDSFLRLLASLNAYRKYLAATDRGALDQELAAVRAELSRDQSEQLRAVKQRRAEILEKRLGRLSQVDESRELVSHQLATIEDLLRLTHEQSISIRDPDSVSQQLELLTAEVQASDETVREMERFMEFTEEIGTSLPPGERVR